MGYLAVTGLLMMGSGVVLMALGLVVMWWDMRSARLAPFWWAVVTVGLLLFWGSVVAGLGVGFLFFSPE